MGKDNHLPNCLWMGYVSSLEVSLVCWLWKKMSQTHLRSMPCHERCNIRCTTTSFDAAAQRTWSNRYPGMKIIGCCLGKEKPWSFLESFWECKLLIWVFDSFCYFLLKKKLMKGGFEVRFIITCLWIELGFQPGPCLVSRNVEGSFFARTPTTFCDTKILWWLLAPRFWMSEMMGKWKTPPLF